MWGVCRRIFEDLADRIQEEQLENRLMRVFSSGGRGSEYLRMGGGREKGYSGSND